MTECNQTTFPFEAHFSRRVEACFNGAEMTTDGGCNAPRCGRVAAATRLNRRTRSPKLMLSFHGVRAASSGLTTEQGDPLGHRRVLVCIPNADCCVVLVIRHRQPPLRRDFQRHHWRKVCSCHWSTVLGFISSAADFHPVQTLESNTHKRRNAG